jgi:hypothetical protein
MTTTRRNLFQFLGGGAVGALITPAPWRLITDTAIWSENWPGIPKPARGEIRTRFTHCSLCTAGCAMRARCVGQQPVSLAGVKTHPVSRGALCPWGIAAHHLPYHPRRLRQNPWQEAAAAVSAALSGGGRMAVLDLRPGRTASWSYRRALAALPKGVYLAPQQPGFAVDLASARTVLSFGAPLLDRWGTPGNVFAARRNFRLIQAEPVETRTAALADEWLAIRPGSESALAAWLAGELPLLEAAARTGIEEGRIAALGKALSENGPALILDRDLTSSAMALNKRFKGTLVARREAPVPESWKKAAPVSDIAAVPDRSLNVLVIDESVPGEYIPWPAIEPKLAGNAVVVAFAWTREGYGRHARYTLPAALFPEALDDIPGAIDSVAATFRLSTPLVAANGPVADPVAFVTKLAGLDAGNALRERADAIHKAGRGSLITYADSKSTAVKDLKAEDFWKGLNEGGCWMEDAVRTPLPYGRGSDKSSPIAEPDASMPLEIVVAESPVGPLCSPLLSKLYRESNLRQPVSRIVLSPFDAQAAHIKDGGAAVLETGRGRFAVLAAVDPGVPPGVVQVAIPILAGRGKVVAA